jgi:hypothetical protein
VTAIDEGTVIVGAAVSYDDGDHTSMKWVSCIHVLVVMSLKFVAIIDRVLASLAAKCE